MITHRKPPLMRWLPLSLFFIICYVFTQPTAIAEEDKQYHMSSAVLHVGIEQKVTGKVGKYGFKTYVYFSEHPQVMGIDPKDDLSKKHGEEKLPKYTNSDYVRFGTLEDRGSNLGKLILADKTGDILKGTFWDSYDVTKYLRRYGNRRYYLATVTKADRKTYSIVGVRCYLEVTTTTGKLIRSEDVYFLGRTESMDGYLARDVRNVGLEIAFDIPPNVDTVK